MENHAHTSRLEAAVKKRENQFCADCGSNAARWASINIGVFLCIECAGIHRGLGTHISKVRSIALDKWTPEAVKAVTLVGNRIANSYYEATLPANFARPQPSNPKAMTAFIVSKYVERKWVAAGSSVPPAERANQGGDSSQRDVVSASEAADEILRPPEGKKRGQSKGRGSKGHQSQPSLLEPRPSVTQPQQHAESSPAVGSPSSPSLLLQDFWAASPQNEVPPPVGKTPPTTQPQEEPAPVSALGYALDPPTLRKVHEAKTTAARESLDQVFVGSGAGFGAATFASTAAQFVWPTCDIQKSTWRLHETTTSPPTPAPSSQSVDTSFKSALNRNLAALANLSNDL